MLRMWVIRSGLVSNWEKWHRSWVNSWVSQSSCIDILHANGSMIICHSTGLPSIGWTNDNRPRVWDLVHEYPPDFGSPTRQDADTLKLRSLYDVKQHCSRKHRAPDTQCLNCDFVGVKGQDLYHHIKYLHPDSRSYACWDCDKNFNMCDGTSCGLVCLGPEQHKLLPYCCQNNGKTQWETKMD